MRTTRVIALFMALTMVLGLAGCAQSFNDALNDVLNNRYKNDKVDKNPGNGESPEPSASGYFDTDIWRADYDYADMLYEHYELEWLEEYTDPIYDMAKNGGDSEDFKEADYYLFEELYYIYTLYTIISNAAYADATDSYAAEEAVYTLGVYYDAYEEYLAAMHALAISDNADLLSSAYGSAYISYFTRYEPSSDEQDELSARENRLIQDYYTLMGAAEPDLEAVAELFVELVEVRNQKAVLYDFESYADYAYNWIYSKDYTPEDAQIVWQGAKEYFIPVLRLFSSDIMDRSADLYYSDFDCSEEKVLEALGNGLSMISPDMRKAYDYMIEHGLYDISASSSKSNVGYTTLLYYFNEPYIFNAATGTYYDYSDMFHEFGHFANFYYTESELVFGLPDNDLSELQSQGLEILFTFLYEYLFDEDVADTMRDDLLLDMAFSVVDGALYDEFQQRVYAEPNLTAERVLELYAEVYEEYGYVPYDGYEYEWVYVSHNFESPFYYISYAVSALGALEINDLCMSDWSEGVDKYLLIEAMDPEFYYYSEALEEAGLSDIFDISAYRAISIALADAIRK